MKKLILALFIPVFFLSIQIPPAISIEDVCDGPKEKTIVVGEQFGMCWTKNSEPDVVDYKIYIYNGDDPVPFNEIAVSHTDFDEGTERGCLTENCFTGPIFSDLGIGTYKFTVTASDGSHESGFADPVTLTIKARPSAPSGCSLKLF